jgi:uncharacterized Zn ribbon protein
MRIYPIVCQGYHLFEPVYVNSDCPTQASFPYTNSDNAEGWEKTTYFKFNQDGITVVWLCPECAKRWNEEKQEKINNILDMAGKVEFLTRRLFLYNELLVLGATKEQKYGFDMKVIEAERAFNIK